MFKSIFNPFTVVAFFAVASAAYTYYDTFLDRSFVIFSTEEEISAAIEHHFPLLVDYL